MSKAYIVASNLVIEDGEILLVQEAKEHVEDKWNLPSGGINKGEDFEEAAKRECREETGLNIEAKTLNGVYVNQSDSHDMDVVVYCFNSKINSGTKEPEPIKNQEIKDAKFVPIEKVEDLDLRTEYILDAVKKSRSRIEHSKEVIKDYR